MRVREFVAPDELPTYNGGSPCIETDARRCVFCRVFASSLLSPRHDTACYASASSAFQIFLFVTQAWSLSSPLASA